MCIRDRAKTFTWFEDYKEVCKWNFREPDVKWFLNGKTNITYNCLDRHLESRGDQTAILWEPNDPNDPVRKYTYQQLYHEVCKLSNALKSLGIAKGDRVVFYMPMLPELAIGIMACARIGAIHSVVFAGFSAQALADRVDDAEAKMIVCSDFNKRGAKLIPVKQVVDDAMDKSCNSVEHVLVYKNSDEEVSWSDDVDKWWHTATEGQAEDCPAEPMDSEDILFIIYLSLIHI